MLKPLSLNKEESEKFKNFSGFAKGDNFGADATSPNTNGSIFTLKNHKKYSTRGPSDLKTATHKHAKVDLVLGEDDNDQGFAVPDSALLPLDSAIPKINPNSMNQKIQKSNRKHLKKNVITSPLTAFTQREKQFKRMRTSPIKEEVDTLTTQTKSRRQVLEDHKTVRDMKETFKELNLTNMSSIPNSYIY